MPNEKYPISLPETRKNKIYSVHNILEGKRLLEHVVFVLELMVQYHRILVVIDHDIHDIDL